MLANSFGRFRLRSIFDVEFLDKKWGPEGILVVFEAPDPQNVHV